jgi:hypothetical protein
VLVEHWRACLDATIVKVEQACDSQNKREVIKSRLPLHHGKRHARAVMKMTRGA